MYNPFVRNDLQPLDDQPERGRLLTTDNEHERLWNTANCESTKYADDIIQHIINLRNVLNFISEEKEFVLECAKVGIRVKRLASDTALIMEHELIKFARKQKADTLEHY